MVAAWPRWRHHRNTAGSCDFGASWHRDCSRVCSCSSQAGLLRAARGGQSGVCCPHTCLPLLFWGSVFAAAVGYMPTACRHLGVCGLLFGSDRPPSSLKNTGAAVLQPYLPLWFSQPNPGRLTLEVETCIQDLLFMDHCQQCHVAYGMFQHLPFCLAAFRMIK